MCYILLLGADYVVETKLRREYVLYSFVNCRLCGIAYVRKRICGIFFYKEQIWFREYLATFNHQTSPTPKE